MNSDETFRAQSILHCKVRYSGRTRMIMAKVTIIKENIHSVSVDDDQRDHCVGHTL